MMGQQKVKISLSLSPDLLKAIDRSAVGIKVTRTAFIEAILRRYLQDRSVIKPPSEDGHQAEWIDSMRGTMKILGDLVSPIDEKLRS